jgi:orotate phosphoribosyltransferase
MEEIRRDLIRRFIECGALKFGDFVLSSGKRSRVYVDVKLASMHPDILEMISNAVKSLVSDLNFQKIACVELGGVPLAVATSLITRKPCVIFRKEKKSYGLGGDRIGDIQRGEKVLVIEDVVTTGKSVMSVVRRIEEAGGRVEAIVTVVDREEWEPDFEKIRHLTRSILKLRDLLNAENGLDTAKS